MKPTYKSDYNVHEELNTNRVSLESIGIEIKSVYEIILNGFSAKMNASALNELRKNPKIEFIEPNFYVSLDQAEIQDDEPINAQAL